MPKEEHRLERLIRLAKEQFDLNLELRLKSMMTESGRPAFMKELTPQERIERFLDPEAKGLIEQQLEPVELGRYYADMLKLIQGERGGGNAT